MLILWKGHQRDPSRGWAHTFLTQMEEVLGTCVDRGIKVVTNAGGLNPSGLADQVRALADRLGLAVRGRPRRGRRPPPPHRGAPARRAPARPPRHRSAAGRGPRPGHLGQRLSRRVAHRRGPQRRGRRGGLPPDHRRLAGGRPGGLAPRLGPHRLGPAGRGGGGRPRHRVRAPGHRGQLRLLHRGRRASSHPGFPIAEVAEDGSSVITKHPGTGGEVSVGTVTAQLLYEIAGPDYPNTDVVARFDTIAVEQQGRDRVRISGARGCPAPAEVKVCLNLLGGWRNSMTFVLTGLDIEEKAAVTLRSLEQALGGAGSFDRFAEFDARLIRSDKADAPINVEATAQLRVTVKDADPDGWDGASPAPPPSWPWPATPDSISPPRRRRARSTACTGRPWCPPAWWSPRRSMPTAGGCPCPTTPTWPSGDDAVLPPPPAPTVSAIASAAPGGRRGAGPRTRRRTDPAPPARHRHRGPVRRQGWQCQRRPVGPHRRGVARGSTRTSPSDASGPSSPRPTSSRSGATPSPTCAPSTSWWWACWARGWPAPPVPIPRPRAWASTFGAGPSTCRSGWCRRA